MDNHSMEQLVKSSNGPLAVLFACMLLQKQKDMTFFSEEDVAHIMGRTDKTTRGHMRQLAQIGFITRTSQGWILTTLGRQQLLEVAQVQQLEPTTCESLPDGTGKNYRYERDVPVNITGETPDDHLSTGKSYRWSPMDGGLPVKITGNDDSVNVVVVNNNDSCIDSQQQQLTPQPVKITGDPEIDRVLKIGLVLCRAASAMLQDEIWPDRVLDWLEQYETRRRFHPENTVHGLAIIAGWIAQIHEFPPANVRNSLSAIVASNVINHRLPRKEYLNRYWEYLPESFTDQVFEVVECIGCWQKECICEE